MIEVRYAGVVVGRSAVIRELDTRGLFLAVTDPLPVGTPVVLRIGDRPGADEVQGKVEVVSESPELVHAGMRIRFTDPRSAALFGTPAQAPAEPLLAPQPLPPPEPPPQPVLVSPPPPTPLGPPPPTEPMAFASTASVGETATTSVPEPTPNDDGDLSVGMDGESGRIPAPDPTAFSGGQGGGKRNRRNRRR